MFCLTVRQIDGVDRSHLGETVAILIVVGRIIDQRIAVFHLGKGQISLKEVKRVAVVIPHGVAAAKVFTVEIITGLTIAKVVLHPGAAGHQVTPQRTLTDPSL